MRTPRGPILQTWWGQFIAVGVLLFVLWASQFIPTQHPAEWGQ